MQPSTEPEPNQGYTSTGQNSTTEQSAATDPSQYTTDGSVVAYTSYGEGDLSASERSPYEKTDDDGYSYSEDEGGDSTYYEGEGGGGEGGVGSDGEGSYTDSDGSSEYSEGPRTRSWLEQQGALLKKQLGDLLDPSRGLLFTPREQAGRQQQ